MMGRVGYGTPWYPRRPAGQADLTITLSDIEAADRALSPEELYLARNANELTVRGAGNELATVDAKFQSGLWDADGRTPTPTQDALIAEARAPAGTTPTGPAPTRTGPPPDYTPWLNLASQTVGASGDVIIAAIRGQNETERRRLEAETARQIRELTFNTTMNAQDRARAQVALNSLMQLLLIRRATQQQQQASQSKTVLLVLAGGVVAVGVAAWALTR